MDEKENQKSRKNGSLFFSIFLPIVLTSALAFGVYQYRDYFKGEAGASGLNGKDGTNGTNGKDGENGKSAYELAVEAGFSGTLEEWLESLKGKDGAPGKDGKDGVNGKDGKDGAPGKDGKDGSNGKSSIEIAVDRLNSMLKTNTSKLTPHERFVEAGISEYNLKNLAHYNNEFYYSLKDKRFIAVDLTNCILTGSTNYAKNSVLPEESNDLFKFSYSLTDISTSYANYLCDFDVEPSALSKEIPIQTSLDVGANNEAFKLNYLNHSGVAKEVVIRTNGASTTLTIDDASTGTIYHYGSAGSLNIIQCHTSSYHENGNIAFAEIAKGRIVLESGSEIKHIHVNANENANGFDTVIITDNGAVALPDAITRDKVDVTEAKPVVTVETGVSSETVYVYPYTDAQESKTGTTEQTATQNTSIASALGKLVLDNGSDAGEKAMSNNEKTEVKTELVNEAKAPEIAKEFEDETTAVVYNMTTGEYYDNLYSAIEEVPENTKTTLVLLKSITGISNKNYEISKNKDIVLDLNGKVLSTVAPDESVAYTVINFGTLRIKDNSDRSLNGSGTGKITSSAIRPDMQDVPGYASNTITNHGKLTIESGVIENKGKGYACFAIDNQTNGTLYTPELVINGGKMLQESERHYAVRMFCNSTTNANKVTVNGGIIEGGYAFWMQTPNDNANMAELVVNGGTFIAYDGFALFFGGSGSTNAGRNYSNTSIVFNDGTLNRVGVAGVSSVDNAPAKFEINGGTINLQLGPNLTPTIKEGLSVSE